MASATYESERARRAAGRRRGELRALEGGRACGPAGSAERAERRGPEPPLRPFLRGAAASALIASGYVALVTAARALLALP
jgi:hypothetical protein